MYAFAKLPAASCPLQATSRICLNVGPRIKSYFSVLPSLCTNQSLRNFCLAVTPQKSETLNQSINQDHTKSIKITQK